MHLRGDERFLLEDNRFVLESLGIEFSEFGREQIIIRSFPEILKEEDPLDFVRDLIEFLKDKGESREGTGFLDELLYFLACRRSYRAGERLSVEEIEKLLELKGELGDWKTCPHGRPLWIKLGLEDLQKLFKRS
jgi:DNA mismatch repair protein MutL